MSRYDWLLFVHVLGAFSFLGGIAALAALQIAAMSSVRASDVALFMTLGRVGEVMVNAGAVVALVFGIWLALDLDYGLDEPWIVASLALWVLSAVLGYFGGKRYAAARREATRLAAGDDRPSTELDALLRDPVAMLVNWGGATAVLAILALMVFKPGS
jgi:uncharacterized membrane protein